MARRGSLEQIFETQIDLLATTLQPNSLRGYRRAVKSFLRYLEANHAHLGKLASLLRDPHILGWLHHLCDQHPLLAKELACCTCCPCGACSTTWLTAANIASRKD